METNSKSQAQNSTLKLRENPQRLRDKIRIGCGAGFAGDRPTAAVKLLHRVPKLDYIVLECLAERTLADRYQAMVAGGKGYDPRLSKWMSMLLPLAVEKGVCIITNMGAMDPVGAKKETVDVARRLGIGVSVAVAYEVSDANLGSSLSSDGHGTLEGGASTYLGAAPIVQCLERYKPQVVITSRVADAALFLAPMVYELGWNWNDFELLAQGAVAGHLLECGCQVAGGYFMHPGDKCRILSHEQLLDLSLPYAEISCRGEICVAKADGSGGVLDCRTCAEQLLYEIGDPGSYITPDVVIDLRDVHFLQLSNDKVLCSGVKPCIFHIPDKLLRLVPMTCGWKGWGEISYGGYGCLRRAQAADFLVRSWMNETCPEVRDCIVSYVIGHDSLKTASTNEGNSCEEQVMDVRLRMDGLFELEEHAARFVEEFIALYTNGPAGGGGISTGCKKEILLEKELVERERIFWITEIEQTKSTSPCNTPSVRGQNEEMQTTAKVNHMNATIYSAPITAAPSGKKVPLYEVAHSRAGDKGNDLNFSLVPHFPQDIERLKMVITPIWVKNVVSVLLDTSPFPDPEANKHKYNKLEQVKVEIYEVRGIQSLNVVVRNVLDGGVNCSRRIDRHGKTISDLILCQKVVLLP